MYELPCVTREMTTRICAEYWFTSCHLFCERVQSFCIKPYNQVSADLIVQMSSKSITIGYQKYLVMVPDLKKHFYIYALYHTLYKC